MASRGKTASTSKRILDKSKFKNGKLGSHSPLAQPPKCPECTSQRVWKDGLRYTKNGDVQRWLCRDCGYRFSQTKPKDPSQPLQKDSRWSINTASAYSLPRQVCELLTEDSKNLAKVTPRTEKQAAGATAQILDYAWQEKKRGLAESTIKQRVYRLRLLVKKGANLTNPENISTVLALSNWTESNKQVFIVAYKSFAKMFNIPWKPPKTRVQRKLPFIPTEAEIDQLIAGCGKKTATFLQVLKDTGARGCETSKIRWIDVNEKSSTITINNPVKGSLARIVKVTPKTIAMIKALLKTRDFIFNPNTATIRKGFMKQRKRIAKTLQNPRLKQIHFHTLRHWKATMEYHRTKDILHVKRLLGHKKLENTEIYTHLINFECDEWHVAYAKNLEEETKLIEAGFEYIRYSERDDVAIYRKRK